MTRISLTGQVHNHLLPYLGHGTIAIDATAGNGHDSLFLAANIGENGHLYAFDIQTQAIASSRKRLATEGLLERVTLIQSGHEHMAAKIPVIHHGSVNIIMFNLGYLPGADKSLITTTATTIKALSTATEILAESGILSILAYPGHTGGSEETAAVIQWAHQLPQQTFTLCMHTPDQNPYTSPQWIEIIKSGDQLLEGPFFPD